MRGHQGSHAEVRAVWQPGDESRCDKRRVARRENGGGIADRERDHECDKQCPARGTGSERRDYRRPHHHTQRIGADDMPRLRLGDMQAVRDIGQQPHCHEFGCPDPESTEGQCEDCAAAHARRHGCRRLHA